MKLKGKIVKKLKQSVRKKMEDTLKRMTKVRKQDNVNLRTIIEKKFAWAVAERNKRIAQKKQIENVILKLEGIILFCKDILEPEKKKEKK